MRKWWVVCGVAVIVLAVLLTLKLTSQRAPVASAPPDRAAADLPVAPAPIAGAAPATAAATLTPEWQLKGPSEWARVYLDSSESMKGFVAGDNGPHARLMKRLKDILVEANVLNFETVRFGLEVAPPQIVSSFQHFGRRGDYNEPDTYLAGPLDDALKWRRNGVVVVLTDGVASVSKYHGPAAGPSARGCALGSDTACLALRIRDYVLANHGFWIVGIRVPFDGPYWSEEGGPQAAPRTKFSQVRVPDRPLYAWIGAADVDQGRAIVTSLLTFARGLKPSAATLAIEVAPGTWERSFIPNDVGDQDLEVPASSFCRRGGALPKSFRPGAAGTMPLIEAATREKGSLAISVPISRVNSAPKEILPLLTFHQQFALDVRPAFSPSGDPPPSIQVAARPAADRLQAREMLDICITGRPPIGLLGKEVDVVAQWSIESAIKTDAPWDTWSTDVDDTLETMRRTVNLSLFFRHLLAQMIRTGQAGTPQQPLLRIRYGP